MALTKSQRQLLDILKKVARGLGEEGRCLTDLIGELSVCRYLNLKWKPSDGYDAIAKNHERVQIKSRKSWTTAVVNPSGRLGKFGRKAGYKFDKGVYVELDQHFEVSGIWEMNVAEIKKLENRLSSGKPLHVGTFRSKARRVYP
jgi:hypothetical protein